MTWGETKIGYSWREFELSRVRVTKGKIKVNVWRKSRRNRFWFESEREVRLSEGSSYRESTVHKSCRTFSKACCYEIQSDSRCFEHLKRETKKLASRRSRSCCLSENRFSFKGSKCFEKVSNWLMVKAVTKGTGYPGTRVNGKSWNYLSHSWQMIT